METILIFSAVLFGSVTAALKDPLVWLFMMIAFGFGIGPFKWRFLLVFAAIVFVVRFGISVNNRSNFGIPQSPMMSSFTGAAGAILCLLMGAVARIFRRKADR